MLLKFGMRQYHQNQLLLYIYILYCQFEDSEGDTALFDVHIYVAKHL